jgi:UrcA family protein
MQEMMMKMKGLMALAACALATSTPALSAENPYAQDEAVLRLGDLDLSTVDGQQRLSIRMDRAARAVCGDRLSSVHLELGARARECRTEVLADIRAQIETRTAALTKTSQPQLAYNR